MLKNVLVITQFNEDVKWAHELAKQYDFDIIVYDKVTENIMKNVGRESSTILHYIINNYHNLPDTMIFMQGTLYDRPNHPLLPLEYYFKCASDEIIGHVRRQDAQHDWMGKGKTCLLTFKQFADKYGFTITETYIKCNNFAIGSNIVLSNPIEYYENLFYNSNLSKRIKPAEAYFCENHNINIYTKSVYLIELFDETLDPKRSSYEYDKDTLFTIGYKMKT